MLRALLVSLFAVLLAGLALAQDEFVPGSEDTLDWEEPAKGLEKMVEEVEPGILYIYSAYQTEFCKAVEKDIMSSKTMARQFKKFVCMKLSSDQESEILKKYEVEVGKAALLFLDCQGNVIEKITEKPDASAVSSAMRKAEKENKEVKKFLDGIEKLYKTGEAYLQKQMFAKALQYFQAIGKSRIEYEDKKGQIKSPYFEKAEKKVAEIKEEATKMLIKAEAALNKDDFSNASILLSKLRAEFSAFDDIMQKVQRDEEELQRRMQQAQQGK
jgi:hypothetical protein